MDVFSTIGLNWEVYNQLNNKVPASETVCQACYHFTTAAGEIHIISSSVAAGTICTPPAAVIKW
jgi:hypothetical protein